MKRKGKRHIVSSKQQKASAKDISQLYIFRDSLTELPLTGFIACSVHGDYSYLLKSGNANTDQLEFQWLKILSLYYEQKEDADCIYNIDHQWQIKVKKLRMATIEAIVKALEQMYNEKLIESLKLWDYEHLEFSHETYFTDLQSVLNGERTTKLEIELLQQELDERKNPDSKPMTEASYYDMVLSYNQCFKTSYAVSQLSTMEFARMCCQYEKYMASMASDI